MPWFRVLGCSGSTNSSHPDESGRDVAWPASSYLYGAGDTKILIDAGNGSYSNLKKLRLKGGLSALSAIVITHAHYDHFFDMGGIWRDHSKAVREKGAEKILLLAPAQVFEEMDKMTGGAWPARCEEAFVRKVIRLSKDPNNLPVEHVGQAWLRFAETEHPAQTVAVEIIDSETGVNVTYTSDTGPGWDAAVFGNAPDLLVHEAMTKLPVKPDFGHCAGRQAGLNARLVGTKRLMLTHMDPDYEFNDRMQVAREAKQEFKGRMDIATPDLCIMDLVREGGVEAHEVMLAELTPSETPALRVVG